ncbi:tRNA dihydrouridine(20/20a) synthase DusA [Pseudoxanthobacter sp.]|uniref:tRNA dihydrouridine(20/20a) synthase DusA n=1 Tax=Pseudoxanthobacter sp. TaxID=1925742 RepID=UPI002FE10BC6
MSAEKPSAYRVAGTAPAFAVAPMIDWTDRHCRFFHRLLSRRALLYTEMITTPAILHGDRARLLGFSAAEHPVALQLGGSQPEALALAARIGADFGYDEINLNVGCPSDRVQDGRFGACLMAEPALVGDCVAAMKAAVAIPVTVKCRIGIDDQDPGPALDALADAVVAAGADALWVHARKAWLRGLSPKENRTIPPLDYDRVFRLRARLAAGPRPVFVGLNGGIGSLEEARALMDRVDGVMLGRAAYQTPALLAGVDRAFYSEAEPPAAPEAVAGAMMDYIAAEGARGVPVAAIARHMLGLFAGQPGARAWRRILTVESHRPGADAAVVAEALDVVRAAAAARAAGPEAA